MTNLLFGSTKRMFILLPMVAMLIFGASLTLVLTMRVRNNPESATSVQRLPGIGFLACLLAGAPTTADQEGDGDAKEGSTDSFMTLRPYSAEEITRLIQECKQQKKAFLLGQDELKRSKERLDLMRKELGTERDEIERLKQTVADEWLELKRSREVFNRKITELDAVEAKNLKQLAATYEGMQPERAAQIFTKLDIETAVKTLHLMRERSSAKIMQLLDPKRAALITQQLILVKR